MKLLSKKPQHDRAFEFGAQRKIELVNGGRIRKPGGVHLASQLVLLPRQHLFGDQLLQEFAIAHLGLSSLLNPTGIDLPHASEFEGGQFVVKRLCHASSPLPTSTGSSTRSRLAT